MKHFVAALTLLYNVLFIVPSMAQDAAESDTPLPTGIMCFGDSITFGVGDGTAPGEYILFSPTTDGTIGYTARLQAQLGVPVDNDGVPGEVFTSSGVFRFIPEILSATGDTVIILEGSNDAIFRTDPTQYQIDLQRAVNVSRAIGKKTILATLPQSCCERSGLLPFLDAYSDRVRAVGVINDLPVADIQQEWQTMCPELSSCTLLNRPEGLHPNSLGYDVISEVLAATIEERAPDFSMDAEEEMASTS